MIRSKFKKMKTACYMLKINALIKVLRKAHVFTKDNNKWLIMCISDVLLGEHMDSTSQGYKEH